MPSAKTVAAAILGLAALLAGPGPAVAASQEGGTEAVASAPAPGDGPPPTAAEMRAAGGAATPQGAKEPPAAGPPRARASAVPPRGSVAVTGERRYPLSTHGRIFYRLPDDPRLFSCSGTVVRSAGASLVLTAGHCVFSPTEEAWHENLTFVPAYRDGDSPFGRFTADTLYTPTGWFVNGDTSYDVGLVTLEEPAQETVGGRRIAFNQPIPRLGRLLLLGYPAEPSSLYDGERPIACDSELLRTFRLGGPPSLMAAPCDMRQGASGGAWLTRAGYLVSLISHGYCDAAPGACNFLLGPYLGDAALRLYREAATSERIRLQFLRTPGEATPARRPAFRFGADATTPVSFECRIDRQPVRRCPAALRLPRLAAGGHFLRVRATDQLGRRAVIGHRFRVVGR